MYWKEPRGILMNCMDKYEAKRLMEEFHVGDYGGHHYWKTMVNKIMRDGFYWPTIFYDTHKKVVACHKWYIFEAKRKFIAFPLKPIQVESPFQQWGLYFIRELNPHSLGKNRGILISTD